MQKFEEPRFGHPWYAKWFTRQSSVYRDEERPVMRLVTNSIDWLVDTHCSESTGWSSYHCVHHCHGNYYSVAFFRYGKLRSAVESKKSNEQDEPSQSSYLHFFRFQFISSRVSVGHVKHFYASIVKTTLFSGNWKHKMLISKLNAFLSIILHKIWF